MSDSDGSEYFKRVVEDIDYIITRLIQLRDDLDVLFKHLSAYTKHEEPISRDQMRYLRILYKKAGERIPEDLEKMSKDEASRRINELKKKLGWIKESSKERK